MEVKWFQPRDFFFSIRVDGRAVAKKKYLFITAAISGTWQRVRPQKSSDITSRATLPVAAGRADRQRRGRVSGVLNALGSRNLGRPWAGWTTHTKASSWHGMSSFVVSPTGPKKSGVTVSTVARARSGGREGRDPFRNRGRSGNSLAKLMSGKNWGKIEIIEWLLSFFF